MIHTNNIIETELEQKTIFVVDLINKLEKISGEKSKDEFIHNYGKLKEQIEQVDKILCDKNEIMEESNINTDINADIDINFEKFNINDLVNMLDDEMVYITNIEKLDIHKFKFLLNLTQTLETKLNNKTIEIIEIIESK